MAALAVGPPAGGACHLQQPATATNTSLLVFFCLYSDVASAAMHVIANIALRLCVQALAGIDKKPIATKDELQAPSAG